MVVESEVLCQAMGRDQPLGRDLGFNLVLFELGPVLIQKRVTHWHCVVNGRMDEEEERRRKVEEGRRRLEKLRSKKQQTAVHAASRPLPSPFATAATRKPPPQFKLPETGRKSSEATPREVVSNKENLPHRCDTLEDSQERQQPGAGCLGKGQDKHELTLDGNTTDPKTLDDQIQRLRELDRSFTAHQRTHSNFSAAENHSQQRHVVETPLNKQDLTQSETPILPTLPVHAVNASDQGKTSQPSESSVPPVSSPLQPSPPQTELPADKNAAPFEHFASASSVPEAAGVPPGYLSPTKLAGAPRSVHFGTGENV